MRDGALRVKGMKEILIRRKEVRGALIKIKSGRRRGWMRFLEAFLVGV